MIISYESIEWIFVLGIVAVIGVRSRKELLFFDRFYATHMPSNAHAKHNKPRHKLAIIIAYNCIAIAIYT